MPRVPLGWLAEYVDLPTPVDPERIAADLARVGLEEEAIHGSTVTGPVVVGRVVTRDPEPQKNGKTINWCRVDVGEHNAVGEDGALVPRGIVCGAHNFEAGDWVVVSLPGAVLPGDFAIAARSTYGHISDGMICSQRELGLGEDHTGIIVLTRMGLDAADLVPGADALPLLGLGELTLEVNVTPDRGYCFSMRGVAREYAHATGAQLRDPADAVVPAAATAGGPVVTVADEAPIHGAVGCDRFVARVVRGVRPDATSPAWMQRRLTQAGMRPLSLAVDVTNYVMLELGQPLHAYDLAKVDGAITVRRARAGEALVTLDGARRQLHPEDLLITDGDGSRVLGLAGVMGGAAVEVDAASTDLLIEGAHFDPISIARTSRRHKLSSEAARRFERGVDPALPPVAVQRVVDLLVELGGGVADPALTDLDQRPPTPTIALDLALPGRLVGVPYTADDVRASLEEIGCSLVADPGDPGRAVVTPPTWRPDLLQPVDLVEEVARLRGYDAIPSVLPQAPAGRGLTAAQRLRRSVSRALAERGLVEVLTYPFTSGAVHDAQGLPADDARRRTLPLANPLSDEAPAMRTSVLDSLVEAVRRNVGRGMADLALFEVGAVVHPGEDRPVAPIPGVAARPSEAELAALHAAIPAQPLHVAGVLTGLRVLATPGRPARAADHGDAIEAALAVGDAAGVALTVRPASDRAPWHPGRCAALALGPDGPVVGHAGELHPQAVAALGLPARAVAFELDLDAVFAAAPDQPRQAEPISPFPPAKEDFAFVVDAGVPAAALLDAVREGAGELLEDVRLFDVYAGEQVGEGRRSLAVALRLRAADRTLTADDTAAVRERVVAAAGARVGAVLRGTSA